MTAYIHGKFGHTDYGTGAAISWSNLPIEGYYDVPVLGRIYAYPIPSEYFTVFPQVFQRWEAVANVTFFQAGHWRDANILVGTGYVDGPGGILGLGVGSPSYLSSTAVGFDSADFPVPDAPTLKKALDVAVHEFGHVIGIWHTDGSAGSAVPFTEHLTGPAILDPIYHGPVAEPIVRPLDIAAAQYLYGAPTEYTSLWGESADVLFATSAGSRIMALGGDDVVIGRAGDDVLFGNIGLDRLEGGAGNDILWGGQNAGTPDATGKRREGVETLDGGAGDDLVFGNFGTDVLFGGDGNDQVWGGQDNDTLDGGPGDDTVIGNKGNDHMTGGAGADLFFGHGGGADVVADFNAAEGDRLMLPGPVTATSTSAAGNLVVHHAAGTMELFGIDPASWVPDVWVTIL